MKNLLFYTGLVLLIGQVWWGVLLMLAGCILSMREVQKRLSGRIE